jgi:hypothetical protein
VTFIVKTFSVVVNTFKRVGTELEFLKSLGLGTEYEEGYYRTCPLGYIGWRNSFLGIASWAP